ncbi:MAG: cell division protein FtsX [Micrococcales bacterium]|nr:MAG: cell division protein FtsX [Micrococcales bacterium]PIE28101.1 MAG: cell division protein FtsX [Micrococcales bacterium]
MRARFVLREIWVALRRNLGMAVSVLLVTFVSLMFVGAAALLQMQVSQIKTYWYDRVQVSIFLCTESSEQPNCGAGGQGVTAEQKRAIEAELTSGPTSRYVDEVFYESSEQAYALFIEQFEGSAVEGNLTPEQMPESYRVKLKDPDQYLVVSQAVRNMQGVDQVQDQSSLLNRLFGLLNGLTAIAVVLGLVMLAAALLLIGTTVRLIAASRRREVEIMRLVGASRLLIQLPFLLEVTLISVLGAVLASGILWGLLQFGVDGYLAQQLRVIDYISADAMVLVAPGLLGLAIVIGVASSLVTTHWHLRV